LALAAQNSARPAKPWPGAVFVAENWAAGNGAGAVAADA